MVNIATKPQPCAVKPANELLVELRLYKERVIASFAKRKEVIEALFKEMGEKQLQLDKLVGEYNMERQALLKFIAAYRESETVIPEQVGKCIAVLEEMLRNPSLPTRLIDATSCSKGDGPCPPVKAKEPFIELYKEPFKNPLELHREMFQRRIKEEARKEKRKRERDG